MPLFQWEEKFGVGDPMMDSQHQKWFGYINELNDVVEAERAEDELTEILENVVIYTQYHFASEERLLKRIEYPRLEEHQQIHEAMVQQMRSLREESTDQQELCRDLATMLAGWLVDHILSEDQRYAAYLTRKTQFEAVLVY